MKTKLTLAGLSRTIARIASIAVLLVGLPLLLFFGLLVFGDPRSLGGIQPFGEPGNLGVLASLLLLAAMIAGLAIAWWKEGLGAAITLASLLGSFALGDAMRLGVGARQGLSLFVGPVNLAFALLVPGYYPGMSPSAKMVPAISWALPTIPALLFFVSWFLRRSIEPRSPEGVATGEESKEG